MADLLEREEVDVDDEGTKPVRRAGAGLKVLPRERREKAENLTGKPNARMIELIERKLDQAAGATLREIGAYVQQRMGTDQSPEQGEPDALKAQRRATELKELDLYVKQAMKYIVETYGELQKDGLGKPMGHGDRLVIEKGHYRKLY